MDPAPLSASVVGGSSGVPAWLAHLAPRRLRDSMLISSIVLGPRIFAPASWLRFLEVQKLGRRLPWRGDLIRLKLRGWGSQCMYIRPRGTDWETLHASLIGKYHRPGDDLPGVSAILDLGSNIGATVADMAVHYPAARIIGVELDADNVALARRNTEHWVSRVSIVHGAAWSTNGEIAYGGNRGEWAYRVLPAMDERTASTIIDTVPAYSLLTLIDRLAPGGDVDYVKMDIEGAESFILDAGDDWAPRVRCIKVEVHLPLDVAGCSGKLERLGFTTVIDPEGIPCVTGYRAAE